MSVMTETGALDRVVRSLYQARSWLWLAFAVPAAVLAGLIMVVLPPQQELANIGDWAFRLSPIVLAVCAVSVLPRNRFGPALLRGPLRYGITGLFAGDSGTGSRFGAGIAAVLVVISGLNDFTFWCIHTFSSGTKPTHFTWATHMIVFLGGPPTVLGAAIFVVVHLLLAVGVLCLPLGRWVDRALLREHD